jgi:hypothetical protein
MNCFDHKKLDRCRIVMRGDQEFSFVPVCVPDPKKLGNYSDAPDEGGGI